MFNKKNTSVLRHNQKECEGSFFFNAGCIEENTYANSAKIHVWIAGGATANAN